MKLTPEQYDELLSRHPSLAARNPRQTTKLEQSPINVALGAAQPKKQAPSRILVRVTSVRNRLLDEDNICEKFLVDCLRYAGLIPGDDPAQTQIQTSQRKVQKGETEHTEIVIEKL